MSKVVHLKLTNEQTDKQEFRKIHIHGIVNGNSKRLNQ